MLLLEPKPGTTHTMPNYGKLAPTCHVNIVVTQPSLTTSRTAAVVHFCSNRSMLLLVLFRPFIHYRTSTLLVRLSQGLECC